jgi:formaldehyde-activating enzyme involved in methanogenesis
MESTKSVWYAEAWAGTGANAAHLNLAVGLKGGPIEQAFLTLMAMPRAGIIPFFTVLQPNWPVKPFTLFVNKADFRSEEHARLPRRESLRASSLPSSAAFFHQSELMNISSSPRCG